jgi:galactokinase
MIVTSPPVKTPRPEAAQIEALVSRLQQNPAVDPAQIRLVKAPLRICPLGAHIDHQLGLVTGMTINQAILRAFAPTANGQVHLESQNFESAIDFSLAEVPPYQKGDWGNYIRGAVLALQQAHHLPHGLVGVVGGEMPIGGLSSSAAVTVAYLLALAALNSLHLAPADNIPLVRYTENQYIGLNNGILDQSVILCSRRDHLTLIDCQSLVISTIPGQIPAGAYDLLVVYSGVSQGLVGTDYNSRVAECQEAARQLLTLAGQPEPPQPRLRHVSPDVFQAEGHRLPDKLRRRAAHFFGEMQRVVDGVAAWQSGDLPGWANWSANRAKARSDVTNRAARS